MKRIILFLTLLVCQPYLIQSQVGIGTTTPNDDAMLEVSSSNRGFLMPRIALNSSKDSAPLNAHIAGMTVYNTATSGSGENRVTPGFYVNNGSEWRRTGNDARSEARWVNKDNSVVLLNLSDGATLRPTGTEFVALDNGNVGIGTDAPANRLTVNIGSSSRGIILTGSSSSSKSISFKELDDNSQGEINWRKESNAIAASIRTIGESTFGRKGIGFFTGDIKNTSSNAPEQMRITADGKVALRNDLLYSPNARLGIQKNQSMTGLNVEGIQVAQKTRNLGFISYPGDFTFRTTGLDQTLSINSGRGTNFKVKDSLNGAIYLKTGNVTRLEISGANVGNGNGGVFIYDDNSNVTAKFTADGKVGVGTDNPKEKLEINGAIKFESGGYTTITDGASTPIPAGGAGTIVYFGNSFYGWLGNSWKKLDN